MCNLPTLNNGGMTEIRWMPPFIAYRVHFSSILEQCLKLHVSINNFQGKWRPDRRGDKCLEELAQSWENYASSEKRGRVHHHHGQVQTSANEPECQRQRIQRIGDS